jgi:hypothetical protein
MISVLGGDVFISRGSSSSKKVENSMADHDAEIAIPLPFLDIKFPEGFLN